MTVEHLIGKSQYGYIKDIRIAVSNRFPNMTDANVEELSRKIDKANTVTACSFCNSATSRHVNQYSMVDLLQNATGEAEEVFEEVIKELDVILKQKRKSVSWKLESVKEAFNLEVREKLNETRMKKI
jgi:hypothetical protein